MIYLAFFASGVSGLIYQVVWVRAFGNVFGNTIHSASLVVAVFMLGLGVGSQALGAWADRRYARAPGSLLRAYGLVELAIAIIGLGISIAIPHLGSIAALASSYTQGPDGWYTLSVPSYLARLAVAIGLLVPITFLMGGTLTLLIRHLVRQDVSIAPNRIAVLYAVNTAGAALGCLLTDFLLVPSLGLFRTQAVAVVLNTGAGLAALALSRASSEPRPLSKKARSSRHQTHVVTSQPEPSHATLAFACTALGLIGFAALGMEILWFRHATILLGGFRAVFALLLTVVLTGIGIGALAGGALARRSPHAARWSMFTQTLFAMTALAGMLLVDVRQLEAAVNAGGAASSLREIWFDIRPLLLLACVPSILMGISFPLANALAGHVEPLVARRAGSLYLANTVGAVCGSLATGFILLPWLGIQVSAAVLAGASALAIVPLYLCSHGPARAEDSPAKAGHYVRENDGPAEAGHYVRGRRSVRLQPDKPNDRLQPDRGLAFAAGTLLAIGVAIAALAILPRDFVIRRALGTEVDQSRLLAQREGLTEVISVTETPERRLLLTNGHAMSSTAWLSQRYMRALAHIPLLMMEDPASVLVIGFGVGNTTHAATLHPSVRRVEIADLSRGILEHAPYFESGNHGVLNDPRVTVFVNDGRQHLQMRAEGSFDLITLEPPPIAYAGVAALYSKEFYELARSRLTSRGFVSQWLPTYQVPGATALSMIRAFVDVFPQSVLLSGAQADLLLVGTTGPTIELDPAHVASALTARLAVRDDLEGVEMGSPREIAGTFVGSSRTLRDATANVRPVTDDWPSTEYSVLSALNPGEDVPATIVALDRLPEWCPRCFANGEPTAAVAGLDAYMRLMDLAYRASPEDGVRLAEAAKAKAPDRRGIAGSYYLGAIVPESAELYNSIGLDYAKRGAFNEAIVMFRKAVELGPDSALAHWHLGAALAEAGAREDAIGHLQRSLAIDPTNRYARDDLDALTARR